MDLASKDGTVTETVTQLADPPPPSATDRQKAYAHALGIDFAPDISSEAISVLIDSAVKSQRDPVEVLTELAARCRVARITYWKFGEPEPSVRLVEPYELMGDVKSTTNGCVTTTIVGRLLVRCWQVTPAPSDGERWRSFNPERIKSVKDGGMAFRPRIPITLASGTIQPIEDADMPSRPKS